MFGKMKSLVTHVEESGADPLASSGLVIINSHLMEVQLIHNRICAGGVNVTLFHSTGSLPRLPASNGKKMQLSTVSYQKITI